MARLRIILPFLGCLAVAPMIAGSDTVPAAVESGIQIHSTLAAYTAALRAEAGELRRELTRLESAGSEFAGDADLQELETSAVRKELAHREAALANPEESHAHFSEFLRDAIEALRPLSSLPDVQTAIRALADGDVARATAALDEASMSDSAPRLLAAEALFQRGWLSEQTGDFRLALRHYERAATLNPSDREYLERAGTMAASMGFYANAVRWAEEALVLPPKQGAAFAPDPSRLLNNLGSARGALADYESARSHFQLALDQALAAGAVAAGEAARSRFSIACLDFATGRIREAAAQFERVLPAYQVIYGPVDTRTAGVLCFLGMCSAALGDTTQAEAWLDQAIAIDLKLGDPARPHLAHARRQLGAIHVTRADFPQALACYQAALEDDRLLLGDDHPSVSNDIQELAYVYQELGDTRRAIDLHQQALAVKLRNFGPHHPEVASEWSDIGSCWRALGDIRTALAFHQKALESNLRTFGPDHPDVARGWNDTGACWIALGETAKALEHFEKALAVELRVRGPDHPYVAVRLNNIGSCWQELGYPRKAVGYFERALEIDARALGANHRTIATRLNNLGTCWADLGDMNKAIDYLQRAMAIDLATLGPDHPNMATYHANIGSCWFDLGEYRKAIASYRAALSGHERAYGTGHPAVARDLERIDACMRMLRQRDPAAAP